MKGNKVLKLVLMVGALSLVLGAGQAMAQASANVVVSATVGNNCDITANPLNFGTYDALGVNPTDVDTSLSIRCTRGTTAYIVLDPGQNYSGGRRMASAGGEFLSYGLYKAAARGAGDVWGNTDPNRQAYTASSRSWQVFPVYGRIPAGQDVQAGASFADLVVASFQF